VLTDQDRKYVYVLGPENKALRRDVKLGRVIDGLRVVSEGLQPGDKVTFAVDPANVHLFDQKSGARLSA